MIVESKHGHNSEDKLLVATPTLLQVRRIDANGTVLKQQSLPSTFLSGNWPWLDVHEAKSIFVFGPYLFDLNTLRPISSACAYSAFPPPIDAGIVRISPDGESVLMAPRTVAHILTVCNLQTGVMNEVSLPLIISAVRCERSLLFVLRVYVCIFMMCVYAFPCRFHTII